MTNYERVLQIIALSEPTTQCTPAPGRPTANGYGQFTHDYRHHYAHVFVCQAAHGPCPPGHEAAHSCGNRTCINPYHIRWATSKENSADRVKHGTQARGERVGGAKLNAAAVFEIRRLASTGASHRSIATRFNISRSHAGDIINRKTWSWLC